MKWHFLLILLFSTALFSQEKKIVITNSPQAVVVIGDDNDVHNVLVYSLTCIITKELSELEVGKNSVFRIEVSGGLRPYRYQWFKDGKPIKGNGDSLELHNVRLNDHGSHISVIVTDSLRFQLKKEIAVLKTLQHYSFGYSSADPYIDSTVMPRMENRRDTLLMHNSDITVKLPNDAQDKYIIIRVPSNEPIKVAWDQDDNNNGRFPDSVFREPFKVGNYTYYISRVGLVFNERKPLKLLNK